MMNQEIDSLIFEYLNSEMVIKRGFHFELSPNGVGTDSFVWFYNRKTSFWEADANELSLRLEIKNEKEITFTIHIINSDLYAIAEEVAVILNWKCLEVGDSGFTERTYTKDMELSLFIEKDKKMIDSYFLGKGLTHITKQEYMQRLYGGYFFKSIIPITPDNDKPHYALRHLHIYNFKGIKNAKIENIDINTRWIFLTGENGIGKTLLLQAIGMSLFETEELSDFERNEFINQDTYLYVAKFMRNPNLITKQVRFDMLGFPPLPNPNKNFVMFGASRLETNVNGKKNEKMAHLLGKTTQLINIDNALYEMKINTLRQISFNILKDTLCSLLDIQDIDIDVVAKRTVYFERNAENPVPFSQLSAGYKNIINLIGNIVIELSAMQILEITDTTKLTGIAIIDEIEAHLHPKMQRFLVEKLTELFPKVQFIVSTHSPIPLLGAPKESVILHVERNKEEGITVERLEIEWENFTPDILFSSPIFGFKNIIPKSHNKDLGIRTEYTYDETLLNDEVERRIKERADEYESVFDN